MKTRFVIHMRSQNGGLRSVSANCFSLQDLAQNLAYAYSNDYKIIGVENCE